LNAGDIMTRQPITATPEMLIAEAVKLMAQHRISGLPVVDATGVVVGIVSEGDLLRRAELGTERQHRRWVELLLGPGRRAREYVDAHARKVGEVMTDEVASVVAETSLADVVRIIERRHIKRLPVIDESGRLVGIVSRADLVHALLASLTQSQPKPGTPGDAELRDMILAEIARQPWGPRYSIDVKVADGVVDLYGAITDEYERPAVRVVAENIAGVKAVRDHLVWVEPVSGLALPAEKAGAPPDHP